MCWGFDLSVALGSSYMNRHDFCLKIKILGVTTMEPNPVALCDLIYYTLSRGL